MSRHDPLANFRFRVEIDGLAVAFFSEVTLGASYVDVIQYREGGDNTIRKLVGLAHYGNVTLKRGVTQSLDLYQWFRQVVSGQIANARRNVVVILTDEALNDVARFVIHNAWPVKIEAPTLNAKGNEVAIESLELTNEGIERVQ